MSKWCPVCNTTLTDGECGKCHWPHNLPRTTELLYSGTHTEQTIDGLRRQLVWVRTERDAWRNIIAMLCGDGGQYHQQHGTAATVEYCKTRFYDLVKRADEAKARAERLREIWLSPGQDEQPGGHITRILHVAVPFLRMDRGEIGYAAANILERLAKQAEEVLTMNDSVVPEQKEDDK